jgi:hypothetical protein
LDVGANPRNQALDPIYKVKKEDHMDELDSDMESIVKQSEKSPDDDSLESKEDVEEKQKIDDNESHQRLMDEINMSDASEPAIISMQDFYALGMVSDNKELFLFNRHI